MVKTNQKYLRLFESGIQRIQEVPKDSQYNSIQENLVNYLKDPINFNVQKQDTVAEKLAKNAEKQPDDLLAMGEKKKKGFAFIGSNNNQESKPIKEEPVKKGFNLRKAETKKEEPPTFDLLSVMSEPQANTQPKQNVASESNLLDSQTQLNPQQIPQQQVPSNIAYNNVQPQPNPYESLYYPQQQFIQKTPINSLQMPVEEKKEKDPKEAAFDFISF